MRKSYAVLGWAFLEVKYHNKLKMSGLKGLKLNGGLKNFSHVITRGQKSESEVGEAEG
jgi:hypothetical protein